MHDNQLHVNKCKSQISIVIWKSDGVRVVTETLNTGKWLKRLPETDKIRNQIQNALNLHISFVTNRPIKR